MQTVTDVCFHPTTPLLASCSKDMSIKFFDYSKTHAKRSVKFIQVPGHAHKRLVTNSHVLYRMRSDFDQSTSTRQVPVFCAPGSAISCEGGLVEGAHFRLRSQATFCWRLARMHESVSTTRAHNRPSFAPTLETITRPR